MASLLAEKVVQPAIKAEHLTYCPTMDLVALATVDVLVHVFRLIGQEFFAVNERQHTGKIVKIAWKPDGTIACPRTCPFPFFNLLY